MRVSDRVGPLWRRAPLRSMRSGVVGLLLVLAVAVTAAAAASAPLFAESAGNNALRSVLDAVPATALAKEAPVVRLVGGQNLRSADQKNYVDQLRRIKGLSEPVVTAVSVGPELQPGRYPAVQAHGTTVAARLAAIPDPQSGLVVTGRGDGQVWLPDPLADLLRVGPGDTVRLEMTGDAPYQIPDGGHAPQPVDVTVAGTYAVAEDGRRPADPAGTTAWSARRGDIPSDTDITSRPAWLVVGDVPTIERIADTTTDNLLWAVESHLDPTISLAQADEVAGQVTTLRRQTRAPQTEVESPVRLGLVSGIEVLVGQADELAAASGTRARLWSSAGVISGLVAVLALALLGATDRRRELAHAAATGVGPGRTAGLWAMETVLPATLGLLLGVGGALAVQRLADRESAHEADTAATAVRAGASVVVVAVLLVAVVGLVANVLVQRPHEARRGRRAPWLGVLVAATVVALLAALTGPVRPPGPVEIAVPVLVAATAGTVLALVVAAALARTRRRSGLPSRSSAPRWLARRRLASSAAPQVLVVCAACVGLTMAMFAAAAVQASATVVADREAVAAGATSTARIEGSWLLDPSTPRAPSGQQIDEGAKVPEAYTPTLPDDQVLVWRNSVGISGLFGYRDLLITDPQKFADVASWGRGQDLQEIRSAVQALAHRADGEPIPVIAVGEPELLAGDSVVVSGQEWQVPAEVVASVDAFPGKGEAPMLIASDTDWLPELGYLDPRLAPPTTSFSPRPYVEASVWSSAPVEDLVASLLRQDVTPIASTTSAEAAQRPALVAATYTRGYQLLLAGFLVVAAAVAAGLYASRTAGRQRAADLLLSRAGMSATGVRRARSWELSALVGLAAVGAVLSVAVVRPLGSTLLDLEPTALPSMRLVVGPWSWLALALATTAVLVGALAVSWFDGRVRGGGSRLGEEAVLRGSD